MFKKLLISGMILAAFAATLNGTTFAPWTSSGSASGTVTAGTLAINVTDGGSSVIDFTPSDVCTNLAPGDVCNATIEVFNVGTLEVTILGSVGSNNSCYVATPLVPGLGETVDGDGAGQNDALDPSDPPFAYIISVQVSDDNGCNGASPGTITVTATASLSSSPHN